MKLEDIIKQYRSEEKMTLQELADRAGLSKAYMSMLEKGKHPQSARRLAPSLETYRKVATALDMTLDGLLAAIDSDQLVHLGDMQSSSQPRDIDRIYEALNTKGQRELCRYGRYLTSRDEFQAEGAEPQVEYIRHYLTAAAAGYAAPIEGEDYENIPRDSETPAAADFCIDIDGDSMEPYIHHGQRVYVQQQAKMQEFDVGVFFVDGDVFCKQWCTDYVGTLHLLSANPKRQDANIAITRDSGRSCVCFGKVILRRRLPKPQYI